MFGEVPVLERFDAAARAGFTGVEMLAPYDFPATELRRRLKDAGLTQVLINSPSGDRAGGERGLACLPGRVNEFRESIRRALDYAVTLECRLINMLAGIRPASVSTDTATALYASNLAWAIEAAKECELKLIIEPVNQRDMHGYLIASQEQGAAIIEAMGRENIGLQFDIYHCQMAQGDITRRLELLMPLISHIQIADVPGRNEPGTGELAWDWIFNIISKLGYTGWIGCEYKPLNDTLSGMSWQKRYGVRSA